MIPNCKKNKQIEEINVNYQFLQEWTFSNDESGYINVQSIANLFYGDETHTIDDVHNDLIKVMNGQARLVCRNNKYNFDIDARITKRPGDSKYIRTASLTWVVNNRVYSESTVSIPTEGTIGTVGFYPREVLIESPIDELTNDNVNAPLSANQGRVLNEKIESLSGSIGTGIAPGDVTNIVVKERNTKLIVSWTDPENVVVSGATLSEWKGTKLIIKEGSPATSVSDGTLVIDSQVKNQYSTNGYTIEGLKNDTQYYISLFPYNTTNAANTKGTNTVTATPKLQCVGDVTDLKVKVGNERLTISWTDPADVTIDGEVIAKWKGTKLVMKQGGYPSNPDDGTLLVNNQTRDTYKTNGYIATGLTNDITYYFALFPYTEDGAVTTSTSNQILGIPKPFKNMILLNDQTNTNPETSCTYSGDATEMTPRLRRMG